MNSEELIKNTDIQRVADEGAKIYDRIKSQYEPAQDGKFLAIDVNTQETFLSNTSTTAVELARKTHPDTVFYVVKIGFSVADVFAHMKLHDTRNCSQ